MSTPRPPIEWVINSSARRISGSNAADRLFPNNIFKKTAEFHRQIPGYKISPLKGLDRLANMLGLGGIWVKDESNRIGLNSFKVLGGSYAIYRFIRDYLKLSDDQPLSFSELSSPELQKKVAGLTFATATDGNHGRGVAWAASKLGCRSVIYVHKHTSQPRIDAIRSNGAEVVIVDGTYDDAVRQAGKDAAKNGWQVISDTSWPGYEDIPRWVMQGYGTMFNEVQEQLAAQGIIKPTHVFVQAGVGALAAATTGFYQKRFGAERPHTMVVEPAEAACLYTSAKAGDGQPHTFPGGLSTIMAGLACGDPSPIAWDVLQECADVFTIAPDYVAAKGMRVYGVPLEGDPFICSGESGAVTLGTLMFLMAMPEAAPLRDYLQLDQDSHILLINTEGNTDPDDFRRVVWEGGDAVPEQYKFYRDMTF